MPRKRSADLALLAAAAVLVAVLAVLRSSQATVPPSYPSTYDTGANGYAALYDLLRLEGARVRRFELPLGELSKGGQTLVLAGDGALNAAAPSASAQKFLDAWVRAGGTLAIFDSRPGRWAKKTLGLPPLRSMPKAARATASCAFAPRLRGAAIAGAFTAGYAPSCKPDRASALLAGGRAAGIVYRRGRGMVIALAGPQPFDNLHLAQAANARIADALLGHGTVRFDERIHGYAAGRSFWEVLPQPMRIALVIALAAALLALAGENLPFAPPYAAQPPEERDSGAYIASLAQMLERGGAAGEAIARLGARCEQVLGPRKGDERARMLLRELRALEAQPRPGAHELQNAGRIFARVRKDYGC